MACTPPTVDACGAVVDPTLASVKEFYGVTLQCSKDLKTSATTGCKPPSAAVKSALTKVPAEVKNKFYGCGNPIPAGIEGLRVLDLGSGSGRDCYVAALMVGPTGSVTGIDMTEEQLSTARSCHAEFAAANAGAVAPMRFIQGYIEDIGGAGVPDGSVDLVISNCVVNLSPNKLRVLQGAMAALAVGGEFHFSDMYCDRRLPVAVRAHEPLYGEGLAGALYINDFEAMCRRVGFADPRVLESTPIVIHDPGFRAICGNIQYVSRTYRLFKLAPDLGEPQCEDYGQVAYYNGTLPGHADRYVLDDHHVFETGRAVVVCGNTAAMLETTYLQKHFRVEGSREVHYGAFACGAAPLTGAGGCSPCC